MKKILLLIIDVIIIAVFNILFFVIGGTSHIAAVWVAYSFIHIAFALSAIMPFIIKNEKILFNMPIITFSGLYFGIQLIVNLAIIFFVFSSLSTAVILNIVMLSIYLIIAISVNIANKDSDMQQEQHKREKHYVNNCSVELKIIMENINDRELKKNIEKAYDVMITSQLSSDESVASIEENIYRLIQDLKFQIANSKIEQAIELSNRIISLANERNLILKTIA